MRILTWNVNVLRTCLDYHPFTSMKKKNVEGLLDELGAQIFCFQEHKTRRQQLEKSMACPGPYDGFWTFPRSKTGYSGVCTFVDSRVCVPLKAEEGITGLLLGEEKGSTMRPPWTLEERVGGYVDADEVEWDDEDGPTAFDPRKLDMEGRAVVCDFGLFILFNLYCPNETNESRRPYKMNFLKCLQDRVRILQSMGREVIIAGDINIMRAPIDSGEGGIRTSAEQHYEHPARRILDNWCAPKGPMIDVVRESWPTREDMFTCWNQKLDARSANYGSRIDLILCTPGLRPWIKGGDICPKVFGSDHCPVYIDLHDHVPDPANPEKTIWIRDALNPPDRPISSAPVYPQDPPRQAPEPPRFATKFYEEFSGRQTTLKNFFGGGGGGGGAKRKMVSASPSPSIVGDTSDAGSAAANGGDEGEVVETQKSETTASTPFGLARAAFDSLETPATSSGGDRGEKKRRKSSGATDLPHDSSASASGASKHANGHRNSTDSVSAKSKPIKPSKPATSSQSTLASFFAPPPSKPKAKRKTSSPPPLPLPTPTPPMSIGADDLPPPLEDEDALVAQAIAEADAAQEEKRKAKKAEVAPIWSNLFAKKLPPLCTVHQQPCKDFIVKIPGPNKGKRFWLCSLPVGAGYDTGRSKRPRQDVNPQFRCDFFLWDSANSRKETPKPPLSDAERAM